MQKIVTFPTDKLTTLDDAMGFLAYASAAMRRENFSADHVIITNINATEQGVSLTLEGVE